MDLGKEAELKELFETDLNRRIEVAHREGLNYWQMEDSCLRMTCDLHLKAAAEYQSKLCQP